MASNFTSRKNKGAFLSFIWIGLIIGLICLFIYSSVTIVEGAGTTICPSYSEGIILGNVETLQLDEISGIVASRKNTNVIWVHNDSGDSALFYALSLQGKLLGTYSLNDASATDWEDMAIGSDPISGEDYLYLGDIGDNSRSRASINVYRTLEPVVSNDQNPVNSDITDWVVLPMQYPSSAKYDAETLLIDPISSDLFVVTKDRAGEGLAHVFRNPAPQVDSVMVTLDLVADISIKELLTGGDVSPSGGAILLRSYTSGTFWERAEGGDLWDAFINSPCAVPLEDEPQGEAIAFTEDGNGYLTISEGVNPPIYFFTKQYEMRYLPLIFR